MSGERRDRIEQIKTQLSPPNPIPSQQQRMFSQMELMERLQVEGLVFPSLSEGYCKLAELFEELASTQGPIIPTTTIAASWASTSWCKERALIFAREGLLLNVMSTGDDSDATMLTLGLIQRLEAMG